MRHVFRCSLAVLLTGVTLALAQPEATAPAAPDAQAAAVAPSPRRPRDLASLIFAHFRSTSTAPKSGPVPALNGQVRPSALPPVSNTEGAVLALPDQITDQITDAALPVEQVPTPAAAFALPMPRAPEQNAPTVLTAMQGPQPTSPMPMPSPPPAAPLPVLPAPTPLPQGVTLQPGSIVGYPDAGSIVGYPDDFPVPLAGRFWTNIEALVWFNSPAPLTTPLVSSGVLGTLGTVTYFDGNDLDYGNYTGSRISLGYWLDPLQTLGVETSGFYIASSGIRMLGVSNTTSVPPEPFSLPFNDTVSGAPSSLTISLVGTSNGSVQVTSNSRLWSAEANFIRTVKSTDFYRCELLGGFRYADLQEDFQTVALTQGLSNNTLTFQGFGIPSSSSLLVADWFYARNQFAGAQIGTRMECRLESLILGMTAKLAVGAMHQVVNIAGVTSLIGGVGATTAVGGVLAQPSNIGRVTRDDISFIPQLGLTLGYQVSRKCRVYAGYDLMYWTNVVRPGSQIDPNINTQQANWSTNFNPGPGTILTNPNPLFVQGTYWINGVNISMEFRY